SIRELIQAVERGEIDILVGTQILAKGYHFPNLTLVGVVDADLSLYGSDIRASEKTFQLLHQVAGRAGRAEIPGEVMLQTHEPDHPVMQALIADERDAFYDTELGQREMMALPPFGRLAAVVVSDPDEDRLDAFCRELVQRQPREPGDADGVKVLGPAAAPIAVVRGRHRRRFLVRGAPGVRLQPYLARWLGGLKTPGALRMRVDIDPYSFL
ncbi:MAG: helicase-related protein, partial [Pseudomonadota bacterium]|nr:helicase-related protein [Pseudomonadota bacterium]